MVRVAIRVIPRSRKNEIGLEANRLKVWLTAPPVAGAANQALISLLAERLQLPKRAIQLVRGETSRQKVLEIEGWTFEEIIKKLKISKAR
jgi:uncharacterized protein (TIGR00251 family)